MVFATSVEPDAIACKGRDDDEVPDLLDNTVQVFALIIFIIIIVPIIDIFFII